MKLNGKNERLKRRYELYLRRAKRFSEPSVDAALAAIDRFEEFVRRKDFALFHIEQASAFVEHLAAQQNERTGKPLSVTTRSHMLGALKAFVLWTADQPGYRQRVRYADAEYFSLSRKDAAVARMQRPVIGPTVAQVRAVIANMPPGTPLERRDRAVIAVALATGARGDALASLRLKHVDLAGGRIWQDPREVRTKASKSIETFFFPVGDDVIAVVESWVACLVRDHGWTPDDPLFPKTRIVCGPDHRFVADGFSREGWSNPQPIRAIFREAFTAAGLPYFHPHSIRHALARLGEELCQNGKEWKAWSQNFGHASPMMTFNAYGQIDRHEQGDILRTLREGRPAAASPDPAAIAAEVLRQMRQAS
jgi:integrase